MIRMVKQWRQYKPGHEFDPGRGVADVLVRRKFAVWIPDISAAATHAERQAIYSERKRNKAK